MADISTLQKKQLFVCDYCGEKGHKIASCFKLNPEHRQAYQAKREMAIHAADLNTSFNKSENEINSEEQHLEKKQDDTNQNKEQLQQQQQQQAGGTLFGRSTSFASNPSITGYQPRPNFHHHHHHHHGHHHGHHFQHFNQSHANPGGHYTPLPPSEVTCFKCGEKGHYANKCNKSVLSFLRGGSNMNPSNQNNPPFEHQS